MSARINNSEWKWVLLWAVLIVALSSVPYLWGAQLASAISEPGGEQYHFLGFTHNIDDGAVYLSWMRQAADGHFFIRNLFTNEPQAARQFNVLFLAMGWFAALTKLPLVLVYHIFRAGLGVAVIFAIWQFSKLFLKNSRQRLLLVPLVGLSSGVGWLIPGPRMPVGPVDEWQPEALTFLSIYLNPLFLAGLMLMLGALYYLILAQRSGRMRYAVFAGLHALVLGNVHTYDVITVAAVWAVYVVVLGIVERRFPSRVIWLSLVAAAIALPSSAYQFYLYSVDDVFRARADSQTLSPALWAFFAGYGLVLLGAVVGAVMSIVADAGAVEEGNKFRARHTRLLLMVWSVIGFTLPYLPVGQQRKLIMGLHIPLCILCAYPLSRLVNRLPVAARNLVPALFIFLTAIGSIKFMHEDLALLNSGKTAPGHPPFIEGSQLDVMRYLRDNTRATDTILAPPSFALFVPAFAGRQVYYGHWSETPDYKTKINEWIELTQPAVDSARKGNLLNATGATHYVSVGELTDDFEGLLILPPEYTTRDLYLYRIGGK